MASCHVLSIVIISLVLFSCSYGIGIESIRIDEKTATYINISWDIDAGSLWEQYSVDIISTSGRSLNGYPVNTTDMSHQMTGLRPEEYYEITVTPWTSEGAGDSSTTNLTTEAIPEGEILVSDVTSSSAFIQWRPVDGVFFYAIEVEPSDAIMGTGGIFEAEVGLTIQLPGTPFNVTLRGGNMDLASAQIRSAPESPVNITLERIGSTEATLSWTPPTSPHDAYEFYLIINSTNERSLFATIQTEDVNGYEFTVTGLSRGALYVFEVGTVLDGSDSFSLQKSDQNDNPSVFGQTAPESPVNITLDQIGSTEATLSWTPPSSPHDAYELYVIINSTNERSLVATIQTEDVNGYEFTVTGLSPGAPYVFEVGTVLDASDSFSLQKSDQNDNPSVFGRTAPESPLNIALERIGSTEATLSWIPPTSPHDAYDVYVIINLTNERSLFATIQTEDVNGYEFTVTGLSPGALYVFEVGTVLDASDSFSLQRSDQNDNPSVFGRTAPESPLHIALERIGSTEATLSWTPPTSPHDAYEFYLIINSTNERSQVATVRTEDVNGYEFTVTGLSSGALYAFEVGTVLGASDHFSLKISDQNDNPSVFGRTAPESPVNITLEPIRSTEATLSWTPPTSPHDAYEFYVINDSTNERSLVATIQTEDVNEFTVTGLSRDTLYVFEVGTVLDASDSFSLQRSDQNDNPSVFGRTEAIDDGEILVSNVTSSSAFIQWKPKEGVSSYTIVAEPSGAIEPLEDISVTVLELTILLRGTVFNVTVRGGDPAMDLASTQIRSAPGAPLEIAVLDIKNDTVKVTLTPPTCPHDGYELYLSNSTTNQKSLVMSVPREDEMSYERTITELSPATIYNVEVGTILNAEGVFPMQRSENNAMMTFETDYAVSHSPNDVMLLISLLAAIIMI